jgi:hypothetical protein
LKAFLKTVPSRTFAKHLGESNHSASEEEVMRVVTTAKMAAEILFTLLTGHFSSEASMRAERQMSFPGV